MPHHLLMNVSYTCAGCNEEFFIDKLCPHFVDEVRRFNYDESGWPDIRCIKCCDEVPGVLRSWFKE